jgi:hypothetical protein
LPQIHRPTFFRIWDRPLIADRLVGHVRKNSIRAMGSRAISTAQSCPPPYRNRPIPVSRAAAKTSCYSCDWAYVAVESREALSLGKGVKGR